MSSKFNIGDIVQIDYGVDFVSGFIVKVYCYNTSGYNSCIEEYYYDVVDFFDGGTDKHINEQWLSSYEDDLKVRHKLLDTQCNTG